MQNILCRYGYFDVPDDNDLIFTSLRKYGEWAQAEIDFLANFIPKEAVIIDAGAFIGTHSRAFSRLVGNSGKVYAFEPNPFIYDNLFANASLSDISNIHCYNLALGKEDKIIKCSLNNNPNNLGSTSLSVSSTNPDSVTVEMKCLDNLKFKRLDFIKADLEGMEYDLLAGGAKLIENKKPIIYLEVNTLQSSYRILEWVDSKDFCAYGVLTSGYNPANYFGNKENIYSDTMECALLLIPNSRIDYFANILSKWECTEIKNLDDLSCLLFHKPQYVKEVWSNSPVYQMLHNH